MTGERVSKTRQARTDEIERLKKVFSESEGGVVTDFRGLKVKEITDLRRRFREKGVGYQVVKNTLTRLAVKDTGYEGLDSLLAGPTGIAFGSEDPIAAAQVAVEFSKDFEALQVKGGFMEGKVLSEGEVVELSKLSGKNELKAQFLSVLNAPSVRLLGVLNGVGQKFLGVLKAQEEKMEAS